MNKKIFNFCKSIVGRAISSVSRILFFKLRFYRISGYWPNISNPKTINEIILKLKASSSENYDIYADKILVRDFIQTKITEHNLTKLKLPNLLLVTETVEAFEKNFTAQSSFIKSNHGSGMCFYFDAIANKTLSQQQLVLMQKWLRTDYYKVTGEACYKNIKRKLFAEQALRCKDGSLPDDIKVHCYCGQPAVIQILRRTSGVLERKTYDENWVEKQWFKNEVLSPDLTLFPKDEIISYSSVLSQGFRYVRVDFYLVDDCLYFSELTFYPASANLPLVSKQVDEELGAKFKVFCDNDASR